MTGAFGDPTNTGRLYRYQRIPRGLIAFLGFGGAYDRLVGAPCKVSSDCQSAYLLLGGSDARVFNGRLEAPRNESVWHDSIALFLYVASFWHRP